MKQLRLRRPRATIISLAVATAGAIAVSTSLAGCGFLVDPTITTVGAVDFSSALAIPPIADSELDETGRRVFELDARQGESDFRLGASTTTWGFNGSYLGPTVIAEAGESVAFNISNSLDEATTVHWHGMHLPAEMDGGPHQMVEPGSSWRPEWTIDQNAATLWYHPHPHGATVKHVQMGLAGMFIVRDDAEAQLPLPREYGVDDVPVIVQDVAFDESNQFAHEQPGFVGALGDQVLVNGTLGPYLDVTTDVIRLRLLNASTARIYDFGFDDEREFALIASDGGLLEKPYQTDSIMLSPGERAEVLVSMEPGETVVLQSIEPDLGGVVGIGGATGGNDSLDVLELRAAPELARQGIVPDSLVPIERLHEADVSAERSFTLDGTRINQENMDMTRIDEVVTVGSTELWSVRNNMAQPHNFHIHDTQFLVLSVDGNAPEPGLSGWKDTVHLRPNEEYRLIMRFEDYSDPDTPYMYHCHLLRHEDEGMMGQFVVIRPGESPGTVIGDGHAHDGHAHDGHAGHEL